MMRLEERVDAIRSRSDFVDFVNELLQDLNQNPDEWENGDLATFLDAVAAWVSDADGYYKNWGKEVLEQPSWQTFGRILLAAKYYE